MRGWTKYESGIYKLEKERLLNLINDLDLKVEVSALDMTDSVSNKRPR